MIRRIILWRLKAEEANLGESMDYVRHIVRVSLRAFFKFAKIVPLANYRRTVPCDAYHVAKLVATKDADCGSCLQIEVNLAKRDGVSPSVIQAVLDGDPELLNAALADVYRFAESVVLADGGEEPFRERVRAKYGEEGLIELALAIASCRVFPVTKRALGYATSCRLMQVNV